jgi:hypothetical protein
MRIISFGFMIISSVEGAACFFCDLDNAGRWQKKFPSTRTSKISPKSPLQATCRRPSQSMPDQHVVLHRDRLGGMQETGSRSPQKRYSYLFLSAITGNQDRVMVASKIVKQQGFGRKKPSAPACISASSD